MIDENKTIEFSINAINNYAEYPEWENFTVSVELKDIFSLIDLYFEYKEENHIEERYAD